MDIFEKYNLRSKTLLKVGGAAVGGLLIVFLAVSLLGSVFNTPLLNKSKLNFLVPGMPGAAGNRAAYEYGSDAAVSESSAPMMYGGVGGSLSTRNVIGSLPYPPVPPAGDDAEAYEVTSYDAIIETGHFKDVCGDIAGLKSKEYVIFQNSNEHDHGCDYAFKVKNENVNEVLGKLKGFDPRELSQNTYTIQQLITDFTSEEDILKKKLATIDETLASALKAYDQITDVATRAQDADSLSKIIESKLQILERLTQQRIAISAQLDQLSRSKADQLDRLKYTYFHVNVYESKIIDGEQLKDSWKGALRAFVEKVNKAFQDITINLVALFFIALQVVLYFFIALFVAKYVWRFAVRVWKK